MTDILSKIAAYKRAEVDALKKQCSLAELEDLITKASPVRGFETAIKTNPNNTPLSLIAEIKKASPSKGLIRSDFNPPQHAMDYEAAGAACLSILTDGPSFQGSIDDFKSARAATTLPCIRKEFILDPWQVAQSRMIGADAILLIMAMIDLKSAQSLLAQAKDYGMDVLVEVHSLEEMEIALNLNHSLYGINNRNLKTFAVDINTTHLIAKTVTSDICLVTESGISTKADVLDLAQSGVKAMLVGESLMRQENLIEATAHLLS